MATKHTYTWFNVDKYTKFLEAYDFNEDQINFLIDQKNNYENLKRSTETEICDKCGKAQEVSYFDEDTYEREMWFTMNRSGLFEDEEENRTGITDWTPAETRQFITEV
jgi:hypothetical protein